MLTVELGETGMRSSVLGFGCSAVMGRSGRRDSLRALGQAWESGISFYDTARCYGYGESEALLGEFLRTRRDKAIVSTKFGIMPSRQSSWKRIAKPVARGLLGLVPSSRSVLQRMASNQVAHRQFSVEVLERSVTQSLRALKSDYIDLLFVHEATAEVLDRDELLVAVEKLIASGKVRAAGISADPSVIKLALSRNRDALRALQFPCNVFDLSSLEIFAATSGVVTIANHPFGGVERVQVTRQRLRSIASAPETPLDVREKLGEVDDSALADVVLNVIRSAAGIQVVIPAMMRATHLCNNVKAVNESRFDRSEIEWLRGAIVGTRQNLDLLARR